MRPSSCPATGVADLDTWLRLERFDYSRVGERWAVLRLLAALGADLGVPAETMLLVQRGQDRTAYPARACALERRLVARQSGGTGSELLWRASFAVPLEVIEYRNALFELAADGESAIALPEPDLRILRPQGLILRPAGASSRRDRRIPVGQARHRLAALATAVAVTTTSSPAIGLAATGAFHGAPTVSAPASSGAVPTTSVAPRTPSALSPNAPERKGRSRAVAHGGRSPLPTPSSAPSHNVVQSRKTHPFWTPASPATPPVCKPAVKIASAAKPPVPLHGHSTAALCVAPAAPHARNVARHHPTASSGTGRSGRPTLTGTGGLPGTPPQTGEPERSGRPISGSGALPGRPTLTAHHRSTQPNSPSGGAPIDPLGGLTSRPPVKLPSSPTHSTPVTPGSSSVPTLTSTPTSSIPPAWTGASSANPVTGDTLTELSGLLANGNQPPTFLIPIYMEAGRRFNVPWEVLAGINAIETDYGRDLSTSSAGAIGWMQFMPATWREYGLAVDGHRVANPFDPRDAIFSAARYLAANGAAQDLPKAILAYNHATWYVDDVLARAQAISDGAHIASAAVHRGVLAVRVANPTVKGGLVTVKGGLLTHYTRLIASANMVSAAQFPYLYGGGHEQPALFGPFDCSGAVSYVMQQAGYKVPTTVSGDIASWGFPAGPGRVTIFFNPVHTYMRIGNRFFGTSGFARPGGGAGWFDTNVLPASYLTQFREVHVPRLGTNSFTRLATASAAHTAKHS